MDFSSILSKFSTKIVSVSGLDYLPASFLALVISLFLISFFYMLFKFLGDEKRLAFIKVEFSEVITSAFIIVFIVSFFSVFNLAASSFIPSEKGTIQQASIHELDLFLKKALILSGTLKMTASCIDTVASLKVNAKPFGLGFSTKPFAFLKSTLHSLETWQTALIIGDITINAQKHIINFSYLLFLKYLLPIGILFRCFSPTRKFGGAIIGLTITFTIVFPLIIIMSYKVVNVLTPSSVYEVTQLINDFGKDLTEILDKINLAAGSISIYELTGILFRRLWLWLTGIILGSVVLPLLNMVLLITSAGTLTKRFGQEVDISNLTRMI